VDQLLLKIDATGSTERKYGSGSKCMAHMSENIYAVEELFYVKKMHLHPKIVEPCITAQK